MIKLKKFNDGKKDIKSFYGFSFYKKIEKIEKKKKEFFDFISDYVKSLEYRGYSGIQEYFEKLYKNLLLLYKENDVYYLEKIVNILKDDKFQEIVSLIHNETGGQKWISNQFLRLFYQNYLVYVYLYLCFYKSIVKRTVWEDLLSNLEDELKNNMINKVFYDGYFKGCKKRL